LTRNCLEPSGHPARFDAAKLALIVKARNLSNLRMVWRSIRATVPDGTGRAQADPHLLASPIRRANDGAQVVRI